MQIVGMGRDRTFVRRHAAPAAMLACVGCVFAAPASAQSNVPPSYGHDFVTIGAVGNRPMLTSERYYNFNLTPVTERVGAVNYEYRIARTETTAGQWLDFVRVAWRVWRDEVRGRFGSEFTSPWISTSGWSTNSASFSLDTFLGATTQTPVGFGWRAAAMYCNWLHNGRPTGPGAEWSVRSGAYDISTFRQNPDNSFSDQIAHSPGALYWIPTLDEWTKAAYYDPNRYGTGQEGYWLYPNQSQTRPVVGPPGQGDGGWLVYPGGPPVSVGSYPTVESPWGLLDLFGGVQEWTETAQTVWTNQYGAVSDNNRFIRGSAAGSSFGAENDDFLRTGYNSLAGLRIASVVPSPSSALVVVLSFSAAVVGRRR